VFKSIKHEVGSSSNETECNISLSTMLNAFDGLFTPHGLIFFMTTNHVENLDPALIRHGRIDIREELGNATPEQSKILYNKYFGQSLTTISEDEDIFIKWSEGRSMAEVHGKLIEYKEDLPGLLRELS
jgi:chaperone BCS1